MLRFVDLIEKKADGESLSTDEIQEIVSGFTKGEIPDYQMSAMMMAILQKGMTLLILGLCSSSQRINLMLP